MGRRTGHTVITLNEVQAGDVFVVWTCGRISNMKINISEGGFVWKITTITALKNPPGLLYWNNADAWVFAQKRISRPGKENCDQRVDNGFLCPQEVFPQGKSG